MERGSNEVHDPTCRSPLVGVVCMDIAKDLVNNFGPGVTSFIAASNVKFLEGAGARVVPIWIGRSSSYYKSIMSMVNGIYLPGGAVYLDNIAQTEFSQKVKLDLRNDCVQSIRLIYEIAVAKNEAGTFFPLMGVCLGFQLLLLNSQVDPRIDFRMKCKPIFRSLPLQFEEGIEKSRLFANLSADMKRTMETEPFGYHSHHLCITKTKLKEQKIDDQWRVLATNQDDDGLELISVVEHTRYPFFGFQIHFERVIYEYLGPDDIYCHSRASIEMAQYFGNFFVNACRCSTQHFTTVAEEARHLIWNFAPTFTGKLGLRWNQCYLFNEGADYPPMGTP